MLPPLGRDLGDNIWSSLEEETEAAYRSCVKNIGSSLTESLHSGFMDDVWDSLGVKIHYSLVNSLLDSHKTGKRSVGGRPSSTAPS